MTRPILNDINRILIIKPSALGDIVHSLPFLHAVKTRFPHAEVDWVAAHGLHRFLEDHPMIDNLWVIKKDKWKKPERIFKTMRELHGLKKALAGRRYDVCIDLSGLFRSGVMSWASGAKIKLGFRESDEGSPFFYTHRIHGSMEIHAIDRYLEIARFMGCEPGRIEYPFAPYDPYPSIMKSLPDRYAVMSPSAGKPANQWFSERFGQLAARLDIPVVVVAGASDKNVADEVVRHSKGKAISIAGKTGLKDLVAVIAKAVFFVCNDTGPMHIAAALDIPVFAIFGPASPVRTGPYGNGHTVIQHPIDCSPCYAKKPCAHFGCMEGIRVDTVHRIIKAKIQP